MKKHTSFFLVALLVSVGSLLAQLPPGVLDLGGPVKVYAIGTLDQPVRAEEYCAFLQDLNMAQRSDAPRIFLNVLPEHLGNGTLSGPPPLIRCAGVPGHFEYSVSAGQESEIITAVFSEQVQQYFHEWRTNPTVPELLSYLNDQIHLAGKGTTTPDAISSWSHTTYGEDAATIVARYSDSVAKSVTLSQADDVAKDLWAPGTLWCGFYNEKGESLLDIPHQTLGDMEKFFVGYQGLPKYHRPAAVVEWSSSK